MRRINERRQQNIFVTLDRRINLRRSLKSTRRKLSDRRSKQEKIIEERRKTTRRSEEVENLQSKFSEYQFTANDLEQFTGFVIKIVMITTNESEAPRFRDFRAIALA